MFKIYFTTIILLLSFSFTSVNADIYDDVKNSRNFTGKVVLVTGSSSGIGEGTVKLFSSLGASVVVTGRNQTNVKRVAAETQKLSPHGLKPLEVVADLSISENIVRLINETIAEFGQLDVLINNAGGGSSSTNILENFDNTFNLDLKAPLYLAHVSLPYLQKSKGTIINISSIAGFIPIANAATYSMAKASLDMLTKVLAVELGSYGIRVNAISPGFILTSNYEVYTEAQLKHFISIVPLQRLGKPIDVANGVVFLASNDAQYITGANLIIDGGVEYNFASNTLTQS